MSDNLVRSRFQSRRAVASGQGQQSQVRLPLVIRPTPVRLTAIERRARTDPTFAGVLAHRPDLCAAMARALLARDPDARRRFVDRATLAAHLQSLRAG